MKISYIWKKWTTSYLYGETNNSMFFPRISPGRKYITKDKERQAYCKSPARINFISIYLLGQHKFRYLPLDTLQRRINWKLTKRHGTFHHYIKGQNPTLISSLHCCTVLHVASISSLLFQLMHFTTL